MPAGLEARRRGLRASCCVSGCCCFSGRVDGVGERESLASGCPARTLKIVAALRLALHAQKGHSRTLAAALCARRTTHICVRNSPRLPFARLRPCPEGSSQDLTEPRHES